MKSEEEIILEFSAKKCEKDKIYQFQIENLDKSINCTQLFQTERLKCYNDNGDVIFQKKLKINFNFGRRQTINICFFKYTMINPQQHKCQKALHKTELSSIITSPDSLYERILTSKNPKRDIFCVKANRVKNDKGNNIMISDFLKSGIKLNIFFAFDFSSGINKQSTIQSLKNYSKIINKFSPVIFHYAKKQSVYLYGYGGKCKTKPNNEDIFNLNSGNNNPTPLDKVHDVYNSAKNNVISEKKVVLSKLIKRITKNIYDLYEPRNYNVLFILARELPDNWDKQDFIDSLIEGSYLPLTIIIIGEGINEFEQLKEYCSSELKEASSGMEKNRNNILYTTFYNNFNENEDKLIQWCLEEISKQLLEFYDLIKCTPKQIWQNQMSAIKQSFMQYNKVSVCIYESRFNQSLFPNNENLIKKEKVEDIKKKNEKNEINICNKNDFPKNNQININNKEQNIINVPEKKIFTPGGSINITLHVDNPYRKNKKSEFNNNNNEIKEEKEENQNDKKKDELYKITPGNSIWTLMPNPYFDLEKKNEEVNITPKERYFIPQQSLNPNAKKKNPYQVEKKLNDIPQKNESKMDSYNISTQESFVISSNSNNKASNIFKNNINYSIDS